MLQVPHACGWSEGRMPEVAPTPKSDRFLEVMAYRRKPTRTPRAVEETAIAVERDKLRESVDQLASRNVNLKSQLTDLKSQLTLSELETEKLLHHKILLCRELHQLRRQLAFLRGQDGLGHEPWDIRRLF